MPGVTRGSSLSMTNCEQWNRTSAMLGVAIINARKLLHHILPDWNLPASASDKRRADVSENDKILVYASSGTKSHSDART
jgi:hypothetical protein